MTIRSAMAGQALKAGYTPRLVQRYHPDCSECRAQFTTENPNEKTCSEVCQKARRKRLKEERPMRK